MRIIYGLQSYLQDDYSSGPFFETEKEAIEHRNRMIVYEKERYGYPHTENHTDVDPFKIYESANEWWQENMVVKE